MPAPDDHSASIGIVVPHPRIAVVWLEVIKNQEADVPEGLNVEVAHK